MTDTFDIERYSYLHKYTSEVKTPERDIVGRKDEMRRIKAALMRPELCNVILLGEAGSGKALADDTLIPVADKRGYVPIGELRVGDMVFDENGKPVEILGVYPQGKKPAYSVVFDNGTSIVCNDEHLWNARTRSQYYASSKYKTVSLRTMLSHGISCGKSGKQWYIPHNKAVKRDFCEFDIPPYRAGIIAIDKEHIHDEYLLGSIQQRYELLRGLSNIDQDTMNKAQFELIVHINNVEFINEIKALISSLGLKVTSVTFIDNDKCADKKYCAQLIVDTTQSDSVINAIIDLKKSVPMTCIYVDSKSHLFQAGKEHIVTHNTMLVQGTKIQDSGRLYLEVDLSKMIADVKNDPNEMASILKKLFDEASEYYANENKELVLFIDEFHQIVQLSSAAVEALKPILADSGTRGVRVIAATTYTEFRKFLSPNQPLVERLQRINIVQPDKEMTVDILKGMAKRYGVDDQFYNDSIYEMIYEYTNRYIPANSQPRKSILVLDNMVGWHRAEGRRLDMSLLSDVIYETEGVNVAFRVDATKIKSELNKNVLSQEFASSIIENRLQVCVADLNNHSKPMSTLLFSGSSGVGKALPDSTRIPIFTNDGTITFKKNGDLVVGDYVFNRYGKPVKVVGVFKQGLRNMYRVTLGDGRVLDCDGSHLWGVYPNKRSRSEGLTVYSTETLLAKGLTTNKASSRPCMKYVIPMNDAVEWPARAYDVDPYVVGAFIGNGCMTLDALTLSSNDEFTVVKVAGLLNADYKRCDKLQRNYNWQFTLNNSNKGQTYGSRRKYIYAWDVFSSIPSLVNIKSHNKHIPSIYMTGSTEQRWSLVQGLFDTDGSIGNCDGDRFNIGYSTVSETLAYDVQELLYSLGVSSSVTSHTRIKEYAGYQREVTEFTVHVKSRNADKWRFFTLPRKLDIARKSTTKDKQREKTFDYVGIRSIEKLNAKESATCIYIDDDEHLYQAGQFVVTHNTEMAKQLARLLFQDDRNLIRFDMTEYANNSSMDRFRTELTTRIWEKPYSIVLLDEIEKASANVTRLLLQVLDDGRLIDVNNREVSFTNSYIILTTNAGSEIYNNIAQYNVDDKGSGEQLRKYNKLIRTSISSTTGDNRFPPELLGRIDAIVPFQPLSEKTMKDIVYKKLIELKREVRQKYGSVLHIDPDVVKYLVEDNLDTDASSGGARNVMSKLESEVTTSVARFINASPGVRDIGIKVMGPMASDHKTKLVSEAYIKVGAVTK